MNENIETDVRPEKTETDSDLVSKMTKTFTAGALSAHELADLFARLIIIAIAFLFLLPLGSYFGYLPREGFPVFLTTMLILVAGVTLFILMMYFLAQDEKLRRHEEKKEFAYVLNQWRISTMKAVGMPEDIITGLESILPEGKQSGKNPELVMKPPFEIDAWILRLSDLLGEDRVIQYEDQLLTHTKTEI